jgi:tetratricopeptide (TPR) repeat protein
VTIRRTALIAALVAVLAYLPALGNRFALDDAAIVERNPAAHSISAAARAFPHPYWPPEHGAGLWRPAVILSFAVDWQLAGGSPAVLHATNVLLHGAVTALVVLFLAPFVTAAGALVGGLLFAVHPVHVEAVANLVGRAELLAALGLLGALVLARRVRRRRAEGGVTWPTEVLMLGSVALGLLSKEHAAIAVALLWLDERADPGGVRRLPRRDYVAVLLLTFGWLAARRAVEGGVSFAAVAPTFFHLGAAGRISTMLPAVFVVVRLFLWPWDLSPDYHPLVIERLEHLTPVGVAGLAVLLACSGLAAALWRHHRSASLGLLVIALAWLPTSNLLFPTGIVLAERTLYAPSIGLVLLAALAADALARRMAPRHAAALAAVALAPCIVRTVVRIPDWRTTRDLVVHALLAHPESYKVHQSAARVLWRLGDRSAALREYGVAAELYPLDHYLLTEIASSALQAGEPKLALRYCERSERLDANYSLTHQLHAHALLLSGTPVAALAQARLAVATAPTGVEAARMLAASFVALSRSDSALAVWPAFRRRGGSAFERWLLGAVTYATEGFPDSARAALDSAAQLVPADTVDRRRLREARAEVALRAVPSR